MRHKVQGRKLGRDSSHRKALIKNQVADLICNGQIVTTLAKAKMMRPPAEKLITIAKRGLAKADVNPGAHVHARRLAAARLPKMRTITDEEGYLEDIDVVKHLFSVVAPKFANRNGGYTRIVKLGKRPGDNADMAVLMLVNDEDEA